MSLHNSIIDTMKNDGKFSEIGWNQVERGNSIISGQGLVYVFLVTQPGEDFKMTPEYALFPKHFQDFLETNFVHKCHPQAFVCDFNCVFKLIDIVPGDYKVQVDENGIPSREAWYASFCLQRLQDRYLNGQIGETIEFIDRMVDNLPKRELEAIQGLMIFQSGIRH